MGVKGPVAAHPARPRASERSRRPARSAREKPVSGRMGAQPPRYVIALNPYPHERYTKCPRCAVLTRARKLPLVIHVEGVGLFVLRKSCRLCPTCEMVIVHQAELEPLIVASFPSIGAPGGRLDYLILGTIDLQHWRRGLAGGSSIEQLTAHMSDFKTGVTLEVSPGGWGPTRPRQ